MTEKRFGDRILQLLRLFSTMPMLFSCGPFRLDSWGAPFRGLASCSCSREPRTELSARVKGDRALRPSLLAVVTDQSSYLREPNSYIGSGAVLAPGKFVIGTAFLFSFTGK